jgi:hexosaminidase
MKNILVILSVLLLAACSSKKDVKIAIIPKPFKVEAGSGSFAISEKTTLVCKSDDEKKIGQFLIDALKKFNNVTLAEKNAETDAVVLSLNDTIKSLGDEGYKLIIANNKIEISAGKPAGLFYGVQSLIQLCGTKGTVVIPCMTIEDKPRFAWCGMHMDESRHFQGKEFAKKFIDILAMHKLNIFHWHLTDDQGWRIEIKKYPKLTTVGAWREDREDENWNIDDDQRLPYPKDKPYYGGFYSQDDIREIVKYAQDRYITIVPEIEMPGHSRAALVAYPEVSCFGKEKKVASTGFVGEKWDFSDPFCAGKEETFEFIQNVLNEVMALFPSQYIHIGGDECSKRIWKTCPKCQARIKKENLKDEFELQSYFVKRIEKYLASKGKRMIGWQEIMEGGMDPSAMIMPWRGDDALKTALEAAQEGHQVIMAPSSYFYFNSGWSDLTLKKTYLYDPIPEGLDEKYHSAIIGLEACIWGEFTPTPASVEYQTMPRIAALAELGWTIKENKNWQCFQARLDDVKAIYKKMNINYYVPEPCGLEAKTIFTDKAIVSIDSAPAGTTIKFTTDGSDPVESSPVYKEKFEVTSTTTIKAESFDQYGQKSKITTGLFEKQDFRKSEDIAVMPENGIKYKSFKGRIKAADLVDQAIPSKCGIIDTIGVIDINGEADGGLVLEGLIGIPAEGIYTFYLASDDGSKLYIGDYNVVDNDGFHGGLDRKGNFIFKSGKIALGKGTHPITIKYFDWGGGEMLKVFIEGPGMEKQEVKKEMLFH